jgi:hypothetical protein
MPRDGTLPQSRLLYLLLRLKEEKRQRQLDDRRRSRAETPVDIASVEIDWKMPCAYTFLIAPIRSLIMREMASGGTWIDPFAGRYSPAHVTNDLDPNSNAQFHLEAMEFLKAQPSASYDGALFDGPYSSTQAKKHYHGFGVHCFDGDKRYEAEIKNELARVIKLGGKVICCGWNSGGLGINRGFTRTHLLIVAHGGGRNDTLVTVEVKK